jgi:hypothetical protein
VPRNVIYITELVNRVFTSQTPFTELDRAQALLADFNGKKTLKTSAKANNMIFEKVDNKTKEKIIDKGSDNDSAIVDDWDQEEAENILKETVDV